MPAALSPSVADALGDLPRFYFEHEAALHRAAAWLMIAVGAAVIVVEVGFNFRAPYGRFATLPEARWYAGLSIRVHVLVV